MDLVSCAMAVVYSHPYISGDTRLEIHALFAESVGLHFHWQFNSFVEPGYILLNRTFAYSHMKNTTRYMNLHRRISEQLDWK